MPTEPALRASMSRSTSAPPAMVPLAAPPAGFRLACRHPLGPQRRRTCADRAPAADARAINNASELLPQGFRINDSPAHCIRGPEGAQSALGAGPAPTRDGRQAAAAPDHLACAFAAHRCRRACPFPHCCRPTCPPLLPCGSRNALLSRSPERHASSCASRVLPGDIHVDSHEPELSSDELAWGRHFWALSWRAASERARRRLRLAAARDSLRMRSRRGGVDRAAPLRPLNPRRGRPRRLPRMRRSIRRRSSRRTLHCRPKAAPAARSPWRG